MKLSNKLFSAIILSFIFFVTGRTAFSYATEQVIQKTYPSVITSMEEMEEVLTKELLSLNPQIYLQFDSKQIRKESLSQLVSKITKNPTVKEVYDGVNMRFVYSNAHSIVNLTLNVNYMESKPGQEKVSQYVLNWIKANINKNMSDEQKVRVIHDFMVKNFQYNFGDANKKSGGYSIYTPSALIFGKGGVCQSYALLFDRMAKGAGLETKYVAGNAWNSSSVGAHAWNLVKIDGQWYHIDVTWDDPIGNTTGKIYYDFYLKSDAQMQKSRSWDNAQFPQASTNYTK